MTDLNSLMIFAKVVEAKSFSGAARLLKMPTSTVSRRVAELEEQLGVRLIERSTRNLRLTDVGLRFSNKRSIARRSAKRSTILLLTIWSPLQGNCGSPPPQHLGLTSCTPYRGLPSSLIGVFQAAYPRVRVQVFITDRIIDHIAEGVDLAFRVDPQLKDSSLVARKILSYRHQLLPSPAYFAGCKKQPQKPQDLLDHRLLAFSFWKPVNVWSFVHVNEKKKKTLTFHPHLSMNDYTGLAVALLAGTGIGDLPPLSGGDCFLLAAGSPYTVRDNLRTTAQSFCSVSSENGRQVIEYGGGGAQTTIIYGWFRFCSTSLKPLARLLPPVIVLRADQPEAPMLRTTMEMLALEMERPGPGSRLVV